MVRGKEKATTNHKKDTVWKYNVQVDVGESDKTYIYLKCNFYEKIVKEGVTRMNDHLSGSHKNVAPCTKVPEEVREEIGGYMKKATLSKFLSQRRFDNIVDISSYFGSGPSGKGSSSTVPSDRGTRGPMDRYVANVDNPIKRNLNVPQRVTGAAAKEERMKVCMNIGRLFYENVISFNVSTSPAYFNMIRSVGVYGRGFKPPSMLNNTEKMIEKIKKIWREIGVTVMYDG